MPGVQLQGDVQSEEPLAFEATWADPLAGLRRFGMLVFPAGPAPEVQLRDLKTHQVFLRRSRCPSLRVEDLALGESVSVFHRQLQLVAYGDAATRARLEPQQERTCALVLPPAVQRLGEALTAAAASGLRLRRLRLCLLSRDEAETICAEAAPGGPSNEHLIDILSSAPIVAVELQGPEAVRRWQEVSGSGDAATASATTTSSRLGGGDDSFWGSASSAAAARTAAFLFGQRKSGAQVGAVAPLYARCSLCLLKPHLLRQGVHAGECLSALLGRFELQGAVLRTLSRAEAAALSTVYDGVLPEAEYAALVEELSSGPVLALALCSTGSAGPAAGEAGNSSSSSSETSVQQLKAICGPADPAVARELEPASLRAAHGADKARNAVHASDLAAEALHELRFFFPEPALG